MEELWERKCLLGLVGERLTQTILLSTRRRYIFVESNFCSENCFCTHLRYVVQKMYIYTSLLRHLDGENYLPLFTQAVELDLFFLLLFFFFVPSLLVPFDFPLSSAAARLT